MFDFNSMTDEELTEVEKGVLAEMVRRQARDQIPAQIADLTARFIEAGGDPADLETTR